MGRHEPSPTGLLQTLPSSPDRARETRWRNSMGWPASSISLTASWTTPFPAPERLMLGMIRVATLTASAPSHRLSSFPRLISMIQSSSSPAERIFALSRSGAFSLMTFPSSSLSRTRVRAFRKMFTKFPDWPTTAPERTPVATPAMAMVPMTAPAPTPTRIAFFLRRPNWSPYRQAANSGRSGTPIRTSSVPSLCRARPMFSEEARVRIPW